MTRILTTHVGSLPRTQEVVDQIFAKEHGKPYQQDEFDRVMTDAVDKTVARQKQAGVNVVSDGETSKISYSTCLLYTSPSPRDS